MGGNNRSSRIAINRIDPGKTARTRGSRRRRAEKGGDFLDLAPAHEQRGESDYEAIEGGQIRRTLPRPITDQQLLFQEKKFGGGSAGPTGTAELRECEQQVPGKDKKFAHEGDRTILAVVHKAAR
jgi:hypothetical protein